MRRSLRFVSLTALLFLWIQIQTSCSPRMSGEGSTVPPAIELTQGESSQKYNIQLDFMKHHMSGMLIVRRMPDNEIRIVAKCYKENEASYKMLSACMRRNGEDETFFYFEKLV